MKDAFGVSRETISKYIVKDGDGYAVMSESGKRLSKPASKAQAVKRLRQIEYFKHRDAVSKIAMQPVFHGTTPEGAAKLVRYIRAKDTSRSAWRPLEGLSRDGSLSPAPRGEFELAFTPRERQGLFTTPSLSHAKRYSLYGRGPSQGGEKTLRSKGRVLVFNAVGVKPKSRGMDLGGREAVYDPKDLGMPIATIHTRRH